MYCGDGDRGDRRRHSEARAAADPGPYAGQGAGEIGQQPGADADGSGTVDIVDMNIVLSDWDKTPTYMLTVNSGSGDGLYDPDSIVAISADAPPTGAEFNVWSGDVAGVAEGGDSDVEVV